MSVHTPPSPSSTKQDCFFTPAELSARWKITPMTLRRWRKEGKIVASHFGRGVRFKLSDVLAYEEQARV